MYNFFYLYTWIELSLLSYEIINDFCAFFHFSAP